MAQAADDTNLASSLSRLHIDPQVSSQIFESQELVGLLLLRCGAQTANRAYTQSRNGRSCRSCAAQPGSSAIRSAGVDW